MSERIILTTGDAPDLCKPSWRADVDFGPDVQATYSYEGTQP